MTKIISPEEATNISIGLKEQEKEVVLAGGCFDILHVGHITFLQKAKEQGDVLFVLLESDENIRKIKGHNRPINTQDDRAKILEYLEMVDYIIKLPPIRNNKDYDNMVISIKPAIIAITAGDPGKVHKDRQAGPIGARVIEVTAPIINKSTTKLIEILNEI